MFKWLKDKLGITNLEENCNLLGEETFRLSNLVLELQAKLKTAESNYDYSNKKNQLVLEELNRLTAVDVDTACRRGNNTVIVTGVLRGKGYVNFYDMDEREFSDVAQMLRSMGKDKWIRNIDSPFDFKGTFKL